MPPSAEPSKPRVLCVDDDPAILELLSRHLRGFCEVSTAPSAERIAATYINCYIGNNAFFVPTYEDPNDAPALAAIREPRMVTGLSTF